MNDSILPMGVSFISGVVLVSGLVFRFCLVAASRWCVLALAFHVLCLESLSFVLLAPLVLQAAVSDLIHGSRSRDARVFPVCPFRGSSLVSKVSCWISWSVVALLRCL